MNVFKDDNTYNLLHQVPSYEKFMKKSLLLEIYKKFLYFCHCKIYSVNWCLMVFRRKHVISLVSLYIYLPSISLNYNYLISFICVEKHRCRPIFLKLKRSVRF